MSDPGRPQPEREDRTVDWLLGELSDGEAGELKQRFRALREAPLTLVERVAEENGLEPLELHPSSIGVRALQHGALDV